MAQEFTELVITFADLDSDRYLPTLNQLNLLYSIPSNTI